MKLLIVLLYIPFYLSLWENCYETFQITYNIVWRLCVLLKQKQFADDLLLYKWKSCHLACQARRNAKKDENKLNILNLEKVLYMIWFSINIFILKFALKIFLMFLRIEPNSQPYWSWRAYLNINIGFIYYRRV